MSVSELNHLMTYVIEGWMLFSAGFISIAFVSFVARRVQEDVEAAELAQIEGQAASLSGSESVTVTEAAAGAAIQSANQTVPKPKASPAKKTDELLGEEKILDEEKEKARLEEVVAISKKLAKDKDKQSNTSSVSVST